MTRNLVAKRGVQGPHGQGLAGQGSPILQESHKAKSRGQESEFFVLETCIVDGVGVKKLHFDWQVKVVPASPGET